jgi:threonine/homoserine/homoserine lactone efflux protein
MKVLIISSDLRISTPARAADIAGAARNAGHSVEVWDRDSWAGALYLIYLGFKQWRSANDPLKIQTSSVSRKNLFFKGLVITIPNPKSLIFIAAFLPQFINTANPIGLQFAMIVPTFLIITFTVTSVWALVAGKATMFLRCQRALQAVSRTSGGLMVAAGVGLAAARRGN